MKKDFAGDLSQLDPRQRFELSVKAIARGDAVFSRRLTHSCDEGGSECLDILHAARECATQVSLAMHQVLGQWDFINLRLLPTLNSNHVDYYYSKFRDCSSRSAAAELVETYLEPLPNNATHAESHDNSIRSSISIEGMVLFVPYLLDSYYDEPETAYMSKGEGVSESFVDCCLCLICCYALDKAREHMATMLAQPWLAFSNLCRSEMGLEPDVVIKAFGAPAAASLIEEFSDELEELAAETEINQDWESFLLSTWHSITG